MVLQSDLPREKIPVLKINEALKLLNDFRLSTKQKALKHLGKNTYFKNNSKVRLG